MGDLYARLGFRKITNKRIHTSLLDYVSNRRNKLSIKATTFWKFDLNPSEVSLPGWILVVSPSNYIDKILLSQINGKKDTREKVKKKLARFNGLSNKDCAGLLILMAKEKGLDIRYLAKALDDIFATTKDEEIQKKALELEMVYLGLGTKVLHAPNCKTVVYSCSESDKVQALRARRDIVILVDRFILDPDYDYSSGGGGAVEHYEITYATKSTIKEAAIPLFSYLTFRVKNLEEWIHRLHDLCIKLEMTDLLIPEDIIPPDNSFYPQLSIPMWKGHKMRFQVLNRFVRFLFEEFDDSSTLAWNEFIDKCKKLISIFNKKKEEHKNDQKVINKSN